MFSRQTHGLAHNHLDGRHIEKVSDFPPNLYLSLFWKLISEFGGLFPVCQSNYRWLEPLIPGCAAESGVGTTDPAGVVESASSYVHIDLNQLVEAAGFGLPPHVDGKLAGLGRRLLRLGRSCRSTT